ADAKGGGHGVPPPPLSLQEDGRIRKISKDVSGIGRSPQSIAFTRVGPEAERHQALGEFRQIAFDSRRLHHSTHLPVRLRRTARFAHGGGPARSNALTDTLDPTSNRQHAPITSP